MSTSSTNQSIAQRFGLPEKQIKNFKLTGSDGNAFAVLGNFKQAARKSG